MKNKLAERRSKTGFLTMDMSGLTLVGLPLMLSDAGTIGSRIVKIAKANSGSMMNAEVRTPQPNPISANKLRSAMGQMTPPRDEPETVTPKATARFRAKYRGTVTKAGRTRNDRPTPNTSPCARKNW